MKKLMPLLFAFTLFGCSSGADTVNTLPTAISTAASSSDAAPTRAPAPTAAPTTGAVNPEVVASGFTVDGEYLHYAFTMKNPDTRALEGVSYQVSFFAADGRPAGSDQGTLSLVLPGETAAVAGQARAIAPGTRMQVSVSPRTRTQVGANVKPFAVVPGTYDAGRFGFGTIVATITNPYSQDLKDIKATAVLYAADGSILSGEFTYVQLVPASGTVVASITLLTKPGTPPAKVEVYAAVSGLTILDLNSLR